MTERDIFIESIPIIAKMTVASRELTEEEYQKWKNESLNNVSEREQGFVQKVLYVIDKYR